MKRFNKLFLFGILNVFFINYIFGSRLSYPMINVSFDNEVPLYLPDDEPKMTEIKKGISEAYKDMWKGINDNGKENLPYCIYDAFMALTNNKDVPFIEFIFSIGGQTTLPTGDCWEGRAGLYAGLPDDRFSGTGIWIFGVWNKLYSISSNEGSKRYCLKGLIFHEMLHFAIDYAIKKKTPIKDEFSVNIIRAPETNIDNLFADEGVIEDCELRLFSCGTDGYKSYASNQFYKNGARKFNPDEEECEKCTVCKNKFKP